MLFVCLPKGSDIWYHVEQMTVIAIWLNKEEADERIWAVSDSRVSQTKKDTTDLLTDHGIKIFSVPVIVKSPNYNTGFFTEKIIDTSIGLCCAGSSLVALNLYATISPVFSQLILVDKLPSLGDIARTIKSVLENITKSRLNNSRIGEEYKHFVEAAIFGYCLVTQKFRIFYLSTSTGTNGIVINLMEQDLSKDDYILLLGDGKLNAKLKIAEERKTNFKLGTLKERFKWWRAPYHTIIKIITSSNQNSTVGGSHLKGIANKNGFNVYRNLPRENQYLDLFKGTEKIGPCETGMMMGPLPIE